MNLNLTKIGKAKIIIGAVALIMFLWLADVCLFFLSPIHFPISKQNQNKNVSASILDYTIRSGATLSSVLYDLGQKGVLTRPTYLKVYAFLTRKMSHIKMGDYHFKKDIKPIELLKQITKGGATQHRFTIIEGWTFEQMIAAMNRNRYLKHEVGGLPKQLIMLRLGYPATYPEGLFFPDTYFFNSGSSDLDLLKRAYALMQKRLMKAWDKRSQDVNYDSPYEALIVASLIEKETALDTDKPLIADVILKRIRRGMRLQFDSTITYVVTTNNLVNMNNATKWNLKLDSIYNTYRYAGLPPTPIALPSMSSIQAALHPQLNSYYYFVSQEDGTAYFSSSFINHKEAVAIYRSRKAKNKTGQKNAQKKVELKNESQQ